MFCSSARSWLCPGLELCSSPGSRCSGAMRTREAPRIRQTTRTLLTEGIKRLSSATCAAGSRRHCGKHAGASRYEARLSEGLISGRFFSGSRVPLVTTISDRTSRVAKESQRKCMQPHKSTPQDLFSKPTRYLVPIFQRGYVWTLQDQIKPLWRDIIYQVDRAKHAGSEELHRKHFLGAIVLKTDSAAGARHVPRSEVIDGQQRLTTLQILLIALRDAIAPLEDAQLSQKLDGLTRNDRVAEPEESYKVWPTSAFQEEFSRIASARSAVAVRSAFPLQKVGRTKLYTRPPLVQAYLFFNEVIGKYLRGEDYNEPVESSDLDILDELIFSLQRNKTEPETSTAGLDLSRAELLIEVITNQLQVIELRLESHDDAQIIFETLNARGAPLKAGDLVRNFVFLQASRDRVAPEPLYQAHWQHFDQTVDPMVAGNKKGRENRFWRIEERQGRLTSARLDLLLFHYLVLRRGGEFKITHLYQVFRDWWEKGPKRDIVEELSRLKFAAGTFRELIERDQRTRFGLFAHRLRILDTTTVFPLVLLLKEREKEMGEVAFLAAIADIESYLIRRVVCRLTPKAYNRIFLSVLQAVSSASSADTGATLRQELLSLRGDTQNWPTDEEVESRWLHDDAYIALRASRVQMILEGLEHSLDTSKQEARPVFDPDRLPSVEHLWPQNGDLSYWSVGMYTSRPDLPAETVVQLRWAIQSFGNLTLLTQPLNSSIGNGPWERTPPSDSPGKRLEILRTSTLRLNQYLHDVQGPWDAAQIQNRARVMFGHFCRQWPRPKNNVTNR